MKKVNGMMYPQTKRPKTTGCKCTGCGKTLTPSTAFYYVDSCNCAITDNAPPYCKECYIEKYKR